jgi:hypothetical protein
VRPVYEDRAILDYWRTGYGDAQVKDLAGRIRHIVQPELEKRNPYGIDSCVKLLLKDGTSLEHRTDFLRGADSAGTMQFGSMGDERVVRKFRALTSQVLAPMDQDRLLSSVLGLPAARDARGIWQALASSNE